MQLDLSNIMKLCGIFLIVIAIVFAILNYRSIGFSFRIIWFGFIFIVGMIAITLGFTFFRKDSTWRKKRGM
jgi:hypothetical protein